MSASGTTDSPAEPFMHWCEVCGREELLITEDAFNAGWDFPPKIGTFGVISPRTCPKCPMAGTVWWAISVDAFSTDMLTPSQLKTMGRILEEVPPGTGTGTAQ
ncbi:hypothetical protein E3T46_05800 [Cryobacterium sp. Hh11]|uniref:hypothetical protein n=1 Tax=Cryobacterium sp. Hh11 TaxID=2555868 RepID=UPI001069BF71|nr:hypothetical protein [Cryobacterium sp. Hh11]TFD52379.1 hypothetical protein E3T46_05800 [Cryobacterium sp. Hh11]